MLISFVKNSLILLFNTVLVAFLTYGLLFVAHYYLRYNISPEDVIRTLSRAVSTYWIIESVTYFSKSEVKKESLTTVS